MPGWTRILALLLPLAAWGAEPSQDPKKLYAARLKEIDAKDAQAWVALADDCERWLLLDKRKEALRKALGLDPDHAEARTRLDERCLMGKWMDADAADAQEAKAMQTKGLAFYGTDWIPTKDAAEAREKDRKEQGWLLETRLDTAHLRIYSDMPLEHTLRLGALMENTLGAYLRFHPPGFVKEGKLEALAAKPITAYCCWTKARFLEVASPFWKAAGGGPMHPDMNGFYSSKDRMLFLFRHEQDASLEFLRVTAAHEFFHGLDHVLAKVPSLTNPRWVHEGRACHFGWSVQGRQVLPGHIDFADQEAYPDLLAQALKDLPLSTLIGIDKAGFNTQSHYIVAWALVHFLAHGEHGRHAERFREFLAGVPDGKVTPEDFARTFGDPKALEPAFKTYALKTLIPAAQASRQSKRRSGASKRP